MKIVGYTIIGFFGLIIIISFGMPDFITRLGLDNSIIATVNGQKVHRFDYLRYRDNRFGHIKNEKMEDLILNYYLGDVLLLQEATRAGLGVSDQRLAELIRNDIPAFKDPQTGKFDPDRYKRIREINHLNNKGFYEMLKKDIIKDDFMTMIKMGISVSPDYIKTQYISDKSSLQIHYSYISDMDLKKRFKNQLTVSDEDINTEMNKNKKEIKDPKSDRARIKLKLENEKYKKLKKELVEKINTIAMKNASFAETSAQLGGKISLSGTFKIGEDVKERDQKTITAISNSPIFLEDCMKLSPGKSSRVIESSSGLYLFTPVSRFIAAAEPSPEETEKIQERIASDTYNMVTSNLMRTLHEKSKIIKNLKTD
ncbi:MAG TPA: SurA N-terminal domain-containing protein [Spirochaetota bacterium]|nr:SurA N-terminal domain-containing protein [Spirochaetota bacterium]HPR46399.1 SurA N-terminal domain-containing protein [Spirochaetota bacterium]